MTTAICADLWNCSAESRQTMELTGSVELEEELRRLAERAQVSCAQQSLAAGEFEDAGGLGG